MACTCISRQWFGVNKSVFHLVLISALLDAASLPTTLCDGKSHGYFSGDVDNFKEPLLYINNQEVREQK